ncbi:MAG: hypothetical protein KDJ29_19075 [Hyphomicrobiales bacterium]|nr:hypothetical protein [Hyphomicrobiales bacterium]
MSEQTASTSAGNHVPMSKDILFLSGLLVILNLVLVAILYFSGSKLVAGGANGAISIADPFKLFQLFFVWLLANLGIGFAMAIVMRRTRESK